MTLLFMNKINDQILIGEMLKEAAISNNKENLNVLIERADHILTVANYEEALKSAGINECVAPLKKALVAKKSALPDPTSTTTSVPALSTPNPAVPDRGSKKYGSLNGKVKNFNGASETIRTEILLVSLNFVILFIFF